MKMSRGAIGNLVSRYRAVLKKCRLLNLLGTLALAGSCILSTSQVATAVEYFEDTTIVIENWPNDNGNIINTSDQNRVIDTGQYSLTIIGTNPNFTQAVGGISRDSAKTTVQGNKLDIQVATTPKTTEDNIAFGYYIENSETNLNSKSTNISSIAGTPQEGWFSESYGIMIHSGILATSGDILSVSSQSDKDSVSTGIYLDGQ